MGIKCKVVRLDEISGSNGPALRVSLSLTNYRPIMHNDAMVAKAQVAILDGKGGADTLQLSELEGRRPVFEQLSSLFSTIQPIELKSILAVNDTVDFEPTSVTGTTVESKGTYVNMRGYFSFNSYQMARVLSNKSSQAPTGAPANAPAKVSVNLTTEDNTDSALDF
jgi:hypothetical protein